MIGKILKGYLIANGLMWAAIGVGDYLQRGLDCDFYENPDEVIIEMFCDAMKSQVEFVKTAGKAVYEALKS